MGLECNMVNLNSEILLYLEDKVEETVKTSVLEFQDVKIDGYNSNGANGYVFFGEHKVFRKRVAIKYYYFGENSHEEVMLLKNIKHDNILSIWDASIVGDGWAYFITDEIQHGTIDDYLVKHNLSIRDSLKITKGILSGLAELHKTENQLLHRDIKPANILIGDNCSPIIVDFGSVKRIELGSDHVNPSKNSILYKPPESFSDGIYNIQSDIYQVGIVMFQVFGGVLSYEFSDYFNKRELKHYQAIEDQFEKSKYIDSVMENKIIKGKLINLDKLPVYVDKQIHKIINKATHIDLEKRYSNTSEFFLDLHKLGSMPDWICENEDKFVCIYDGIDYQIRKTSKGYVFEKACKNNSWRKVIGIDYCTKIEKIFDAVHKNFK